MVRAKKSFAQIVALAAGEGGPLGEVRAARPADIPYYVVQPHHRKAGGSGSAQ
jgi:hypothetical protein